MKIALLVSSMNAGGAERVAATLANAWTQEGHTVLLVPCFAQSIGQSFYPLDPQVQLHWLASDLPKNKWIARLTKPRVLRRVLKQAQPDIVVSFLTNVNITALLATRKTPFKVIACERTNPVIQTNLSFTLKQLRQRLYPKAAMVTVQTDAAADAFLKAMPALKQVAVIPNPLPLPLQSKVQALWQASEERLKTGATPVASPSKIVLGMGRLVPSKQFDVLINCFAQLAPRYPDWQLHIYGQGPEQERLQTLIDSLNLNNQIALKGRTDQPWEVMQDATVFAMTSAIEGFPNVMLEAMASGLPTVCFDCPSGPAELSQQGHAALLVPMGDQERFTQELSLLMESEELRQRLIRRAARHILSNYTLDSVLDIWDGVFKEVGITPSKPAEPIAPH